MVVAAQPESCKARISVESAHLFVDTFRFTKANVGFISGIDVEVTLMMCMPGSVLPLRIWFLVNFHCLLLPLRLGGCLVFLIGNIF
jgi:hypothetical protein